MWNEGFHAISNVSLFIRVVHVCVRLLHHRYQHFINYVIRFCLVFTAGRAHRNPALEWHIKFIAQLSSFGISFSSTNRTGRALVQSMSTSIFQWGWLKPACLVNLRALCIIPNSIWRKPVQRNHDGTHDYIQTLLLAVLIHGLLHWFGSTLREDQAENQ